MARLTLPPFLMPIPPPFCEGCRAHPHRLENGGKTGKTIKECDEKNSLSLKWFKRWDNPCPNQGSPRELPRAAGAADGASSTRVPQQKMLRPCFWLFAPLPITAGLGVPGGSTAGHRNRPAKSSSWCAVKPEGTDKSSFQIIEPTIGKTSRLIGTTCSTRSSLTDRWNICTAESWGDETPGASCRGEGIKKFN